MSRQKPKDGVELVLATEWGDTTQRHQTKRAESPELPNMILDSGH